MWTTIAELHVWCESVQLMAEWNVQYTKYSTIHNTMYHIIMSADIRNGRIFLVRMSHHDTGSGLLEYTSESSWFILGYPNPSGHKWRLRTPNTYKIHITQSYVKILDPTQQVGRIIGQKKTYSIYMYYCCFKSCKYWLRSDIS